MCYHQGSWYELKCFLKWILDLTTSWRGSKQVERFNRLRPRHGHVPWLLGNSHKACMFIPAFVWWCRRLSNVISGRGFANADYVMGVHYFLSTYANGELDITNIQVHAEPGGRKTHLRHHKIPPPLLSRTCGTILWCHPSQTAQSIKQVDQSSDQQCTFWPRTSQRLCRGGWEPLV